MADAKWSAFGAGSAIADANNVVGLQSGANVKWTWSAVKTYILGSATAVLAIAAGKTFTVSKTLTLTGTDSTTMTFPATSATIARTDAANAFAGVQTVASATATPAAGSTAARLLFGTTAGFGIYYGSGAPTVSAAQGSLYLRSDGTGTNDRAYINSSSGSGTTWTALTTAG
jgi:hypothetical protein